MKNINQGISQLFQRILTLIKKNLNIKKNRVYPYPYPPPQSKVKVSRHGTVTDKWPFRNSFTSQFLLESISNMLSIYRLLNPVDPSFFFYSFKICFGLFAFHLAFSSVFICNGFIWWKGVHIRDRIHTSMIQCEIFPLLIVDVEPFLHTIKQKDILNPDSLANINII